MTHNFHHFVNGARNVCWLSGVLKRIDEGTILVCPSVDVTRGIQVNVHRGLRSPPDGSVVEVLCHVYGTHSTYTNVRSLRVDATYFKRASISALPARVGRLSAFAPKANPWATFAEMKETMAQSFAHIASKESEEVREEIGDVREIAASIISSTQRENSRSAGFQNKVILTGFVGAKAMRQATAEDDAHLYIQIHQHPDVERAIPVRIYGSVGNLGQMLRTLFPVNLVGEIAFQDHADEEGVLSRQMYVRVKKNEVGAANGSDFESQQLPSWWLRAFAAHRARSQAQSAATRTVDAPAVKSAPVPDAPVSAAAPLGVDVSDL